MNLNDFDPDDTASKCGPSSTVASVELLIEHSILDDLRASGGATIGQLQQAYNIPRDHVVKALDALERQKRAEMKGRTPSGAALWVWA